MGIMPPAFPITKRNTERILKFITTHSKIKLINVRKETMIVAIKLLWLHNLVNPYVTHWNWSEMFEVVEVSQWCTKIVQLLSLQCIPLNESVFVEQVSGQILAVWD